MEKNKKKQEWSQDELDLLEQLYHLFSSKKWKRISQVFKDKGFNRSQVDCREKWINFLDPELNKNDWTDSELQKLYEIHDQVGTKWCVIQKYIGRTQNKIKNRFYGTLRNYVRFLVNHFEDGNKCYNFQISKLSPKFLNAMYRAENQFRFLNEEIKNSIFQMRFKIDKPMLSQRINSRKNLYQRLKSIIFKSFQEINQENQSEDQVSAGPQTEHINFMKNEDLLQSSAIKLQGNTTIRAQFKYCNTQKSQPQISQDLDWSNYYPFLNFPFQQYQP